MFKNNNPEFYFALIVVAAVSFFAGSLMTSNTGAVVQSFVVQTGVSGQLLDIPRGSIATGFASSASVHSLGWGIYRAELIDGRYVLKNNIPVYHSVYGRESELILSPGKYLVFADGSPEQNVTISYRLE